MKPNELNISNQLNSRLPILASIFLGLTAVIFFLLLPLFIGVMSDYSTYSTLQLSLISSADLGGFFIGSIISVFLVRRANWRSIAFVALIFVIINNACCYFYLESFWAFFPLRISNGMAQGVLITVFSAHISDTLKPERNYAIFLGSQTLIAAVFLIILPNQLLKFQNPTPIFIVQTLLAVIGLAIGNRFLPKSGLKRKELEVEAGEKTPIFPVIAVIAWMLFYIGEGGSWAFMERIGNSFGFEANFVGLVLGISMSGSFAGSFLAGLLSLKWGRKIPIFLTLMIQPFCFLLLLKGGNQWTFLTGTLCFAFLWSFVIPYLIGILIAIDKSGVAVLVANPIFALGVSIAPPLISLFITGNEILPVFYVYLTVFISGMFIFLLLDKRLSGVQQKSN